MFSRHHPSQRMCRVKVATIPTCAVYILQTYTLHSALNALASVPLFEGRSRHFYLLLIPLSKSSTGGALSVRFTPLHTQCLSCGVVSVRSF
eukprot:619885-Pyramimonas_sp.AAC.1